jgi:hypothetical protein
MPISAKENEMPINLILIAPYRPWAAWILVVCAMMVALAV